MLQSQSWTVNAVQRRAGSRGSTHPPACIMGGNICYKRDSHGYHRGENLGVEVMVHASSSTAAGCSVPSAASLFPQVVRHAYKDELRVPLEGL